MGNPARPLPFWLRASRALGLSGLAQAAISGRPTIVMYHGVADDPMPHGKFFPNAAFSDQMAALARSFSVVPLSAIVAWSEGSAALPPRAIAITFDDAYRNLLDVAVPELARHGFPATIFTTSVSLDDSEALLWFDEMECHLHAARDLPSRLEIAGHAFELPPGATVTAASRSVIGSMKTLLHSERERIVEAVRERFPATRDARSRYGLLTREHLRTLPAGVEVGGHTHRHVILSRESPEIQREEIIGNFRALAAAVGKPPSSFAYPNGRMEDVTADTMRFVREAGYRMAVTAGPGLPRRGGDLLTVPRVSASFFGAYGTDDALDLLPLRVSVSAWRQA